MLAVEAGDLYLLTATDPGVAQRRACAGNHENSSGTRNWSEAEELVGKRLPRGARQDDVTHTVALWGWNSGRRKFRGFDQIQQQPKDWTSS